jgi:diadenosine tetraphosphate (Ap4A) HIT family hydrolase
MAQPLKEPWNKVIHETPSFVVTPTVGALKEGWTLIISKRHVPAIGALTEEELAELSDLVINARGVTRSIYGSAVIFEHGPACEGTSFGCGVDHAHLHVVPLKIALRPLVEKELKSAVIWETMANIRNLSKIHLEKKSYLYILENDREYGIVACLRNIPSQLMRLIIAKSLGIPELYDYRKYRFRNNVIATLDRLETAYIEKPCLVWSK